MSASTRKSVFYLSALILLLVAAPFDGQADEPGYDRNYGIGTLEIRSQAVGQSMRLTLPMMVPGDIPRGWRSYLGATLCNIWSNDPAYLLDYELLDTNVGIGYGFNDNWGLVLMIDDRSYFGGAMDGFIENFHDIFGIDQDGRDTHPNNRSVIYRFDPETGDTITEISAAELDNTGASLLLNYNFTFDKWWWPSINIYGLTRYALQTPDVFDQKGNFDYGVGMGISKQLGADWYAYGVVGYTFYADRGRTSEGNVLFYDRQKTGMFALAWHYRPDFAYMLQILYTDAAIKSIQGLDEPSHEIHLGFKWRYDNRYIIDFALIENVISWDNSPDFGLHLGLSINI